MEEIVNSFPSRSVSFPVRHQVRSSLRRFRFASLASGESHREVGFEGRHVLVFNGQTLFSSEDTISDS